MWVELHKNLLLLFLLFIAALIDAEKSWKLSKYRAIWFHIPLPLSKFIPILAESHFKYHHAKGDDAVMYKFICDTEIDNIPKYPFTNIGVGAVVIDSQNRVLVVKEKYPLGVKKLWKFPGGSADQGEDIGETAEREVFEETGIRATFHSILTLKHWHEYLFGSDIFITCAMTVDETEPNALQLKKCNQEMEDVAWIDVKQVLPRLSAFSRYALEQYWLMKQTGFALKQKKDYSHQTLYGIIQSQD